MVDADHMLGRSADQSFADSSKNLRTFSALSISYRAYYASWRPPMPITILLTPARKAERIRSKHNSCCKRQRTTRNDAAFRVASLFRILSSSLREASSMTFPPRVRCRLQSHNQHSISNPAVEPFVRISYRTYRFRKIGIVLCFLRIYNEGKFVCAGSISYDKYSASK